MPAEHAGDCIGSPIISRVQTAPEDILIEKRNSGSASGYRAPRRRETRQACLPLLCFHALRLPRQGTNFSMHLARHNSMHCTSCGLEIAPESTHGSTLECLEALQREAARLRVTMAERASTAIYSVEMPRRRGSNRGADVRPENREC